MVAFLGRRADRRLLEGELDGLPGVTPRPVPTPTTGRHERLVAAGSLMTAVTLIGGAAMAIFGAEQLLVGDGGALAAELLVLGLVLVATHWGWVHVAEYLGLGIDQRLQHADRGREDAWLGSVEPYPRFTVATSVLADASTSIERILYQPVLTGQDTFSFTREPGAAFTFAADTPAEVIADRLETLRREARLETDRQAELWSTAATSYAAALHSADDDRQHLAAQRAAATALSEHLNASLLEPPVVE